MANTGTELGALSEAINDKMDRDIQNSATGIQTVVETWHDDNGNFYRVWSDGWIEQGGVIPTQSAEYTATITFRKSYSNVNYVLVGGLLTAWSGALVNSSAQHMMVASSKTITGFTTLVPNTGVCKTWYACGY